MISFSQGDVKENNMSLPGRNFKDQCVIFYGNFSFCLVPGMRTVGNRILS